MNNKNCGEGWENIAVILGVFLSAYIITFLMTMAYGVKSSDLIRCETYKTRRIDYIFPAFKFGCWLGEEVSNEN